MIGYLINLQKFSLCDRFNDMVRLVNEKNAKYVANFLSGILKIQEIFTQIKSVNLPKTEPCIYALWHGHQFCVYGLPNRINVNILVSTSIDGNIITQCLKNLGLKAIRGSTGKKGAVGGTMQILEALKNGECVAITVDGPRGPYHKVKGGIVKIAQMANVPIVPVVWYCPQKNFLTIPSWDKMTTPLGFTRIINLYGEPIHIPQNITKEEETFYLEKIKTSLEELEDKAPEIYNEVKPEIPCKLNLDLNYPRCK